MSAFGCVPLVKLRGLEETRDFGDENLERDCVLKSCVSPLAYETFASLGGIVRSLIARVETAVADAGAARISRESLLFGGQAESSGASA